MPLNPLILNPLALTPRMSPCLRRSGSIRGYKRSSPPTPRERGDHRRAPHSEDVEAAEVPLVRGRPTANRRKRKKKKEYNRHEQKQIARIMVSYTLGFFILAIFAFYVFYFIY